MEKNKGRNRIDYSEVENTLNHHRAMRSKNSAKSLKAQKSIQLGPLDSIGIEMNPHVKSTL